jgi:hypothetical protein
MEVDINLYDRCARENNEKERLKDSQRVASKTKWQAIADAASARGVAADVR